MQEETGPSSEGSPSETNISPETTGGTQTPDRESATEEQLQKLVIGSNAEPQKSEDVVYTSETPPDQVPGEVDNSPETTGDAQTPNEGSTTEDQPGEEIPPDVPPPHDLKAGESQKHAKEASAPPTPDQPTKQPTPEPAKGGPESVAEPTQEQEAVDQVVEDSRGKILEDQPVAGQEEPKGVIGWLRNRFSVQPTTKVPTPQPESEQKTPEPTKSEQPSPAEIATDGETQVNKSPQPTEQPTSETSQSEQKPIEKEVQERYSNLKPGDEFHIGKTGYTIDKFDEESVGGEKIVRVRLLKPNGNTYYHYDHEIKAELEKQIVVERKEAVKAEKEQDKAERKEQKSKYKEAKSTSKEYIEQKVANLRDQLENPTKFDRASSNQAITLDGKQYQYVKYVREFSNPYLVRDENGNNRHLSKDEINRALRHEANLESQAKLANLKPKTQEKPAKQKVSKEEAKAEKDRQQRAEAYAKFKERKDKEPELEQEKGPSAIQKLAEKTLPGKIFYRQAMALLNNYNLKDRNMVAWATGAGLGVANTAAAMFLPGPGTLAAKFIRLGIGVGFTRAVSFGLNPLRSWAEGKVLDKAGVTNPTQRNELKEDFASNHQLLREGKFDDYIKAQNETSRKAMLKEGQIENWATDLARAALIRDMENIQSRFENYNKSAKDLVAGAMALSLAGGLGIGAISIFSSGGDSIAPGDGGAEDAPGTDDAPTEAPVGDADTPTGEPGTDTTVGTEPTPTEPPSLSEILENPEYASSLEIQQGDTIGQLLTDGGYDIDWGPDNAQVFGAHIEANYDMLQGMNEQVAAAGISVEDFPTQGEISTLVSQASAGDAVAMHRLTEAMHWIPTGGEFTILSPEAVELINNPQGV